MITQNAIPKERIVEFCQRHHIRKLALFGSALRDDFRVDSDLDVLVEFEPQHVPGLAFFAMEQELAQIFGRKVDLNTLNFISADFRKEIQAKALVLYEQA